MGGLCEMECENVVAELLVGMVHGFVRWCECVELGKDVERV